ncbi:HET-domain-containing protein [Cucurbitaria berberidis CBS 394.84]|uniref:HET-domain-containing protein n=1 Tax=Cucurbitaria berberidis CBS 394.84 TaxID=1168544 RepID=A0A9P4GCH3_9PLEO|nr:HET-domain-containing protein [Cucurbitaria berberidis CBS 394.84]KAF1842816.1 HET-domain-containing protein [Cucurbitaria berberidis CBS 394.84]
MRLLHSTTFEFEVFHDDQIPPYAILSHTWGEEEVSYQEMWFLQKLVALPDHLRQNHAFVAALEAAAGHNISTNVRESMGDRAGYKKIEQTAKLAKEKKLDYFWVDTCCIDKSSSAELQQAINSMYQWYNRSSFCIVYLEDARTVVYDQRDGDYLYKVLKESRWVTRGWTLQELIAPFLVNFYDQEWNHIFDKHNFSSTICAITGIPTYVLSSGDLSQASVAQKMSWAAHRKTTRKEDMAYSLMGIFAIHMAMLNGEGDNAFRRLQEEIMRTSSDDSIFAWRALQGSPSGFRGLLARSPREFQNSQHIVCGEHNHIAYATLNLGLRIETCIQPVPRKGMSRIWDKSLYLCMLNAEFPTGKKVALLLQQLESLKYTRVQANACWDWTTLQDNPTTLYIEHTPQIPRNFRSSAMHCFHLKRSSSKESVSLYQIDCVRPYDLWDGKHQELLIPEYDTPYGDTERFSQHDFAISKGRKHFIGIIWLSCVNSFLRTLIQVLVGYDRSTGRVWCRALYSGSQHGPWPNLHAPTKDWRAALHHFGDFQDCGSHDEIDLSTLSGKPGTEENINVKINPGLHCGLISHIVEIDGLSYYPHGMGAPVLRAQSNL